MFPFIISLFPATSAILSFSILLQKNAHFRNLAKECICPPEQAQCTCGGKRRAELLTRKAVDPTPEEIAKNSPSRSAKLRVIRKERD